MRRRVSLPRHELPRREGDLQLQFARQAGPDEITIQVWKRHLDALTILSHYKPHEDLLILDGLPRNRRQAELVEEHLDVLSLVHLVCPDTEAMVHRIRRRAIRDNRVDDASEDVIRRRFTVYEEETRPVLEYYPRKIVHEVDAIGSPAEVLLKVLTYLVPAQNATFAANIARTTHWFESPIRLHAKEQNRGPGRNQAPCVCLTSVELVSNPSAGQIRVTRCRASRADNGF